MEILWESEIFDGDFGYTNYCCKPIIWNNKLCYAYDKLDKEKISKSGFYGTKIFVLEFNLNTGEYISKEISFDYDFNSANPKERKVIRTEDWKFIIADGKIFLYIGFLLEISEDGITVFEIDFHLKPKVVESRYFVNDKVLNYNQMSTIECYDQKSSSKLWKLKIKGYLYTNIDYKEGYIIFGTAGKGGALYCVNLNNGNILTEYSNTGASSYEWLGNDILISDIKGNLVKIDPLRNQVIEVVLLQDKIFQSPILFTNCLIFTTTHNRKKNLTKVVCIQA